MIVVDTNVVAYLLLPGEFTEAARAALVRDPDWAAPGLWRSEMRNVLALYVRQGHLSVDDALHVNAAAEERLAGREYVVDGADVLRLASASGRTAYDCEFVSLARALGVPFVTSDAQLLASFPETTVSLASFGATSA